MSKPVYVYDMHQQIFIEVPADKAQYSVGRERGCNLVTPSSIRGISRRQVDVQHFPGGILKLIQRSERCETHYGNSEDDMRQLYPGETVDISVGSYIQFGSYSKFGEGYFLKVLPANDELVQGRLEERCDDTDIIEGS